MRRSVEFDSVNAHEKLSIRHDGSAKINDSFEINAYESDYAELSAPNYDTHPLVLGKGFKPDDIDVRPVNLITRRESGLCLLTINNPATCNRLKSKKYPVTYRIHAELGKRTDTMFADGKILEKTTFFHLEKRPQRFNSLLHSIQSSHQKEAFKYLQVSLQSQEAYEIAAKGPVRPENLSDGLIYKLNCVSYSPPDITLWMYALDMQQKMLEPLSPMTQSSLLSFAELFSYMMSEGRNRNNNSNQRRSPPIGVNPNENAHEAPANRPPTGPQGAPNHSSSSAPNHPPVNFCDIMSVFEKAVTEVRQGQEAFHNNLNNTNNSPPERDITYFNRTLVIILHLICLLTKLLPHLDTKQTHQVKKAVYNFIKVGARGRSGATPLHLACSRDSSAVGRYPICQFPSAEDVALLLECGADIEARDHDHNLALHITALNKPAKPNVVNTLLEAGAHSDAINAEGKTFGQLLKNQAQHEVIS